jgi:hypothetical protein
MSKFRTWPVLTQPDSTGVLRDIEQTLGALNVALATQIAGEDLTADVLKVEQRWLYKTISASGVIAAAGSALFGGFFCNTTAGGTLAIYDAASGLTTVTLLPAVAPAALTMYAWPATICDNGIQAVIAAAALNVTIFYQLIRRA